jgi:hypothetical protein
MKKIIITLVVIQMFCPLTRGQEAIVAPKTEELLDQITEAIIQGAAPNPEDTLRLEEWEILRKTREPVIPLLLDRITASSIIEPHGSFMFRELMKNKQPSSQNQLLTKRGNWNNLLLNSSFEQAGKFWVPTSVNTISVDSVIRLHGKCGMYLLNGGISQEATVVPGKKYGFSVRSLFQDQPIGWKGIVLMEWSINGVWRKGAVDQMAFKGDEKTNWYAIEIEDRCPENCEKIKVSFINENSNVYPWLLDYSVLREIE